jgi:hypothetical protein
MSEAKRARAFVGQRTQERGCPPCVFWCGFVTDVLARRRPYSPASAGAGGRNREWECLMLLKPTRPRAPQASVGELATRRKREAVEGALAMHEYRAAQRAVVERMVALREKRLAELSRKTG